MFPVKPVAAVLVLAATSGCFLEAEVKEVCQRSPTVRIPGVAVPGDAPQQPLTLTQQVDFAVPVTLGEKLTLDVALKRVTVAAAEGTGGADFLSKVDLSVEPREGAFAQPVAASLAPRADGSFGFDGALDVTPLLSGETFRYRVEAEGTVPETARAFDVEACVTARLWLSLP